MSRPSLSDYGTHDESAFPELWESVNAAWCPLLGPTGTRLHDFSRRMNWGNFSNITAADGWTIADGNYALNFVSSTNQSVVVAAGTFNNLNLGPTRFSCSAWARPTSAGTSVGREVFSRYFGSSAPFISYGLDWGGSGTANRWRFNLGVSPNTLRQIESTATFSLNQTYHVVGVYNGASQQIWVNGALAAERAETADVVYSTEGLTIGRYAGNADSNESFAGQVYQVVLRDYAMTRGHIIQEYLAGPGGMFQRRRRRYSFEQAVTTNRRRRILCGDYS